MARVLKKVYEAVIDDCEKVITFLQQMNFPQEGEYEDGDLAFDVSEIIPELEADEEVVLDLVCAYLTREGFVAAWDWSVDSDTKRYTINIDLFETSLLEQLEPRIRVTFG